VSLARDPTFYVWVVLLFVGFGGLAWNLNWQGEQLVCNRKQQNVICARQTVRAFGGAAVQGSLHGVKTAEAVSAAERGGQNLIRVKNGIGQSLEMAGAFSVEAAEKTAEQIRTLIAAKAKDPVATILVRPPSPYIFLVLFGLCALAPFFRRKDPAGDGPAQAGGVATGEGKSDAEKAEG
jgi:hypothetical protein